MHAHAQTVTPPLMPQAEQLHPDVFQISWNAPIGTGQFDSSVVYELSCQSLITEIASPPPITTAPGQILVTVGNLSYGVTYNCSIQAHLQQIVSLPAYICITTMDIGVLC